MLTLVTDVFLVCVGAVHAKQTPEQQCHKGRYDAAAQYVACEQKALGKVAGGGDLQKYEVAIGKCGSKYRTTWAKLQKKASGTGSPCDNPRFADNGDGTVTDRLTGLQWEQKTDDGTVHSKDNQYSWSTSADGDVTDADGTAFSDFLASLNTSGCFAGQCNWRLPTQAELQTILLGPYPCTTSPCIDQGIFGPTVAGFYWSATTNATPLGFAWLVFFFDGFVDLDSKTYDFYVRAVRAGL